MAKNPASNRPGREQRAAKKVAGMAEPSARSVTAGSSVSTLSGIGKPGAGASAGSTVGSSKTGNDTRGRVTGYTVGRPGLVVKLDVSAISRIAFSVGAEEPHFRSAVSMTMIALNNRVNPATQASSGYDQQYLWVRLESGTEGQKIRPALVVAMSNSTDIDPFDIDGWIYAPNL